jgi:hypothetical protein
MTLYQMSPENPYTKPFRTSFTIAIFFLLIALCLSVFAPHSLADHTRKLIAEIAAGIAIAAIALGVRFSTAKSFWNVRKDHRIELSDVMLSQWRAGSIAYQIPFDQIISITESRGRWLVVRGSEPGQRIGIPRSIVGFEKLKREICSNSRVPVSRIKLSLGLFLPAPALLLVAAFLIFSDDRRVIVAAGVAAYILVFVILASILYLRAFRP